MFRNPQKLADHDGVISLCSTYIESLTDLKKQLKIGGTELVLLLQYELDTLSRALFTGSVSLSDEKIRELIEDEACGTSATLMSLYRSELVELLTESSCIVELREEDIDLSREKLCDLILTDEGYAEDATPLWKVAAAMFFAMHQMQAESRRTN